MVVSKETLIDVIEWDVYNWNKALSHWLPDVAALKGMNPRVLCLGERNGGLSLWFALQGYRVICSDYQGPREAAYALHARYGVSHLVEYVDVSIFELPYAENTFDVVACKSVIGGLKLDYKDKKTRTLQNQKFAIEEVRRVMKTGGIFCGAENMRGSWLHMATRKLLKGDKIGWRHLRVNEVYSLFDNFENKQFKFFGFFGSYYGNRILNLIFSSLDYLLSYVLPKNWQYIVFITAKK